MHSTKIEYNVTKKRRLYSKAIGFKAISSSSPWCGSRIDLIPGADPGFLLGGGAP